MPYTLEQLRTLVNKVPSERGNIEALPAKERSANQTLSLLYAQLNAEAARLGEDLAATPAVFVLRSSVTDLVENLGDPRKKPHAPQLLAGSPSPIEMQLASAYRYYAGSEAMRESLPRFAANLGLRTLGKDVPVPGEYLADARERSLQANDPDVTTAVNDLRAA